MGLALKRIDYRTKKAEREALQLQIGQDGSYLLTAIYSDPAPQWLRQLPTVDVMLRIWRQQYYIEADQVQWRSDKQLPPFKLLIVSPDDIEARNRTKRETNWSGYAAHLTETCHSDEPNLITNVVTTPATTADVEVTPTVHQDLADKALLPEEHFVDTAYTSVDNLLDAGGKHNIDLVGPVAGGGSWQAKAGKGFDVSCFAVDWDNQIATCPQGKPVKTGICARKSMGINTLKFVSPRPTVNLARTGLIVPNQNEASGSFL
jgi:transposase